MVPLSPHAGFWGPGQATMFIQAWVGSAIFHPQCPGQEEDPRKETVWHRRAEARLPVTSTSPPEIQKPRAGAESELAQLRVSSSSTAHWEGGNGEAQHTAQLPRGREEVRAPGSEVQASHGKP